MSKRLGETQIQTAERRQETSFIHALTLCRLALSAGLKEDLRNEDLELMCHVWSSICSSEAKDFGVCLVSIIGEHQRERRELGRLKRKDLIFSVVRTC